jgi:hypothetical protein
MELDYVIPAKAEIQVSEPARLRMPLKTWIPGQARNDEQEQEKEQAKVDI